MHLEDFLEPLDVLPGFFEVRQKALLQLRIGRLICHFRQRLGELLLGVIDVLKLMHEQIVHGLDVFCEQSHRSDPLGFREHGGIGLHEKPLIPPCSIADEALTSAWHRRSKKVPHRLRWNNAAGGRI
jgi:hypothetical protein